MKCKCGHQGYRGYVETLRYWEYKTAAQDVPRPVTPYKCWGGLWHWRERDGLAVNIAETLKPKPRPKYAPLNVPKPGPRTL